MATIAYWMYGFQNDAIKYLTWVAIVELQVSAGAGLLYLFSALSKDLEQSNLLATVFILLFMLFDGNWISLKEIQKCFLFNCCCEKGIKKKKRA